MTIREDLIESADRIAAKLMKDVAEHRAECMENYPQPINDTQARIQALTIDNGWLIQKLANYEALIMEFGKRLNEMEIFIKAPGNSHLRKG